MISLPKRGATALALSAISLLSAVVYAGSSTIGTPRATADETATPQFGITGDWGGLRTSLVDAGFSINAAYTGEWISNLRGGKSQGGVFEGLAKLTLDVDLQKAAGLEGATFRISGLAPHGASPTSRHIGDASIASNIDAYDSVRLVDFWLEQRLLDGQVSVKLGQMRLDDEFGVTDTAAMFVNSTFGVPNTAATTMPLATYPVGALGVRARFEPIKGLYGQVGLYDGNPSSGDFADPTTGRRGTSSRHGTDWTFRHSEGFLWASEIGYQRCCEEYPGAVRLGFLHHTDGFARIGAGGVDGSNNSFYFVADQTLWQKPGSPKEGLSAFVRGVGAQQRRNDMHRSGQIGLTYTGIATGDDKIGLAYTHNKFNRNSTAFPGANVESVIELTYQYPVTSYFRVQPDVQLIRNPAQSRTYGNALVVGLRATLDF